MFLYSKNKIELINLFEKNKHLKTSNIPHLSITEYKDGWGYAYDVYFGENKSIRVSQKQIFYYNSNISSILPCCKHDLTPEEYEKLTFDLPRRYKKLKTNNHEWI